MKLNKLYSITTAIVMISAIFAVVINNHHTEVIKEYNSISPSSISKEQKAYLIENVESIAVLFFSLSAILISASLTSYTKRITKKKLFRIPLILLFGLTSPALYLTLFLLAAIARTGRSDEGWAYIYIFGIIWPVGIALLAILVNFIMLTKKD